MASAAGASRCTPGSARMRCSRSASRLPIRTTSFRSIAAAQITLPPGSFLQATLAGEATLAALVAEHAGHARHVADLFCGVGPFALKLAAKAKVSAFDNDAGAVAALQKAAAATSGLKP